VEQRPRQLALPELFLGLTAIAVAVVLTAHIFAGTIHDVRHSRDTLSVTGSARVPIDANLARWSLAVAPQASSRAKAARQLRRESAYVRDFLRKAGIPSTAISLSVVQTSTIVTRLSKHRLRTRYSVSQEVEVSTRQIDVVEATATRIGQLLERGVDVSPSPIQYLSTELTKAKLDALAAATEEARHRAEILIHGLGGKLGRMRNSSQGVFQVTPRDSTEVSDYGISDTSSREKDVNAVVSATFDVKR